MARGIIRPQAFERYDLDKDGAISLAEYNRVSGKTAPTTPGTPAPPATSGASGGMASQIENIIKTVDKNVDGRITKAEAGDAPWFARVDQNADGVIDATELETVRKMAARGAGGGGGRGMPANGPTITPEEVAEVTQDKAALRHLLRKRKDSARAYFDELAATVHECELRVLLVQMVW